MKLISIFLISSFFLFSCQSQKKDADNNDESTLCVNHLEYYGNGQRKFLTEEMNGKKDGIFYRWSKTGKIKTKGQFKKGKRIGTWEWFDDRGFTCMKICYQL